MPLLKLVHLSAVLLSFLLFFLRGIWLLRGSPVMRQRWVRIVPHTVDTVLLASAVGLAWQLGYTPFNAPWLAAKIAALLGYIGLGMLAFRFARTRRSRLSAWLAAQGVFLYIIAVAVTRNPAPLFP